MEENFSVVEEKETEGVIGDMGEQKDRFGRHSKVDQTFIMMSLLFVILLSSTEIRTMSYCQLPWCNFKNAMTSSFHRAFYTYHRT